MHPFGEHAICHSPTVCSLAELRKLTAAVLQTEGPTSRVKSVLLSCKSRKLLSQMEFAISQISSQQEPSKKIAPKAIGKRSEFSRVKSTSSPDV